MQSGFLLGLGPRLLSYPPMVMSIDMASWPRHMTIAEIASQYSKSERTVRRWQAAGLDFNDSEAVAKYANDKDARSKGASRNRILDVRTKANSAKTPAVAAVIVEAEEVDPSSEGAPAALARIGRIERLLNERLERAIASGDDAAISIARQDVAPIAALLVRLDKEISQARRDSGELIHKSEAMLAYRAAITWIRHAVMKFLSQDCPKLCAIQTPEEMEQAVLSGISNGIAAHWNLSLGTPVPLPDWAFQICMEEWPGPRR